MKRLDPVSRNVARLLATYLFLVAGLSQSVLAVTAEMFLEVTGQVSIQKSALRLNRSTQTYDAVVSITNRGPETLRLPSTLEVRTSNPAVLVSNSQGTAPSGDPFIAIPLPREGLKAGQTVSGVVLKFKNRESATFSFASVMRATLLRQVFAKPDISITSGTAVAPLVLDDGSSIPVFSNQLMLTFEEDISEAALLSVLASLRDQGAAIIGEIPQTKTVQIRTLPGQLLSTWNRLATMPGVMISVPDMASSTEGAATPDSFTCKPNIPTDSPLDCDWWLNRISARQAWDVTTGVASVPIGILDKDIPPFIGSKPVSLIVGPGLRSTFAPSPGGHGAVVASVAGASGDDSDPFVGLTWRSPLLGANVDTKFLKEEELGRDGSLAATNLMPLLVSLIESGASVINVSWGAPTCKDIECLINPNTPLDRRLWRMGMTPAVILAKKKNSLIVFSAGNDGETTPGAKADNQLFPQTNAPAFWGDAWREATIIVGATGIGTFTRGPEDQFKKNETNLPTIFSREGKVVDIFAPGVNIGAAAQSKSSLFNDYQGYVNVGTSFAAPQATGTAALVKAANTKLSAQQVKQTILDSACEIGGNKILNASRAVRLASGEKLPEKFQVALAAGSQGVYELNLPSPQFPKVITFPAASGQEDINPTWSPDARQLVYMRLYSECANGACNRRSELHKVNADGTGDTVIPLGPEASGRLIVSPIAWSPDGLRLLIGAESIYEITLSPKLDIRKVTTPSAFSEDISPTWSPDGRQLVYIRNFFGSEGRRSELRKMSADGTSDALIPLPSSITNGGNINSSVAWSPDGASLLFAAGETQTTSQALYLLDLSSPIVVPPKQMTFPITIRGDVSEFETDKNPAWSPDGRQILYVRLFNNSQGRRSELHKMNGDGTFDTVIPLPPSFTSNRFLQSTVNWSPCFSP